MSSSLSAEQAKKLRITSLITALIPLVTSVVHVLIYYNTASALNGTDINNYIGTVEDALATAEGSKAHALQASKDAQDAATAATQAAKTARETQAAATAAARAAQKDAKQALRANRKGWFSKK